VDYFAVRVSVSPHSVLVLLLQPEPETVYRKMDKFHSVLLNTLYINSVDKQDFFQVTCARNSEAL